MLRQENNGEDAVVAVWHLPNLEIGTKVEMLELAVQEPQLITGIWPFVPPDSIWREMVLVVPMNIEGMPAKLILAGKRNGRPYSYQDINACLKLPNLFNRIERNAWVDSGTPVSEQALPEQPAIRYQEPTLTQSEGGETAVSAEKKAALAIYALRSLEVYRYGKRVSPAEWGSEKALGLLAYLLWKRAEGATREELSEAIWPEKTVEEANNVFNVTLHRLRNVLEPNRKRGSRYILLELNRYRLVMDETVWFDAQELEEANEQQDVSMLSRAVDLYHAGYLEDVAWALPPEAEIERRRYERLYEKALRILIQKLTPREREIYLYRLLQLVPTDQEAHELLLADYLTTDRIDLAKSHMAKLRKLSTDETWQDLPDELIP